MSASSLYVGAVSHHRLRPVSHSLRYRMFWLLVDLDRLADLDRRLALFAYNRFNLFSFHDRDHGERNGGPVRDWIHSKLTAAGISCDGPIELLCMPRILGYAFNPLSVYFCYRQNRELAAILYEVHNTFGERHSYLARIDGEAGTLRHDGEKRFHVSPFMDMKMRYAFSVEPPGERIAVTIKGSDESGPLITAALAGTRRELTDSALLRVFVTHPLLTLKVIGAIHWHALRLWWKGVEVRAKPAAPVENMTKLDLSRRGKI